MCRRTGGKWASSGNFTQRASMITKKNYIWWRALALSFSLSACETTTDESNDGAAQVHDAAKDADSTAVPRDAAATPEVASLICAYSDPCPNGCQALQGGVYDSSKGCKRTVAVVACYQSQCRQAQAYWCHQKTGGIVFSNIDCGPPFDPTEWQACGADALGVYANAPSCE